jgi:hypothetical protein
MECRNGSPFGLEPMGVVTQLVADALAPPGHARFARLRPGGARASAFGGWGVGGLGVRRGWGGLSWKFAGVQWLRCFLPAQGVQLAIE